MKIENINKKIYYKVITTPLITKPVIKRRLSPLANYIIKMATLPNSPFANLFDIVNREANTVNGSISSLLTPHILNIIFPLIVVKNDFPNSVQLSVPNRIRLRSVIMGYVEKNKGQLGHEIIDDIVVIIDCLVMAGHLEYYVPRTNTSTADATSAEGAASGSADHADHADHADEEETTDSTQVEDA